MAEHLPVAAEKYRWTIGEFTWAYDPLWPRFHRWGVSAHGRGVGGSLNPLTAYVAWRRWMKQPAIPSDEASS